LRVGGLAYACNDTLSEVAITDIMGQRLSAAHALRRNISIVRATSLLGGCAVVASCSMIVAWLKTRSGSACASGSQNETSCAAHLIEATPACTKKTHNAIRSNLPTRNFPNEAILDRGRVSDMHAAAR
jgi:hypothetical protein